MNMKQHVINILAKTLVGISILSILPQSSLGRPAIPAKTVNCSFNGVPERCDLEWGTDGTIILTWPGGPTNYYECGRYVNGKGIVSSRGKQYSSSCVVTENEAIFKTNNGVTKFNL